MSRAGLRRPIQPPPLRSPQRGHWPGYPRSNGGLHGTWRVTEGNDEATVKKLNDAVGEASRNARAAGYTPAGIARIISTPSDVYMFSRLPEADQKAILRQANKEEFERYITHAHQKIRAPMREERGGNAAAARAPTLAVPVPAPTSPPRSAPPPLSTGRSPADDLLRASPLSAR